jgi:hypothetical protein
VSHEALECLSRGHSHGHIDEGASMLLSSTSDFHELRVLRQLTIGNHDLNRSRRSKGNIWTVDLASIFSEFRHVVTTTGHVKERGLVKKDNAHCEVFLRKGKDAKGMSGWRLSQ